MVFNGKFKSCAEPVSPPVSEPQLYLQPSALDINRCVNDVSGELGGGLCSPNNNQLFPAFPPCELKDNQSRTVGLDSSYGSICSQLNFIFLLIKNFKAAFMKPLQTQFSRSDNKNAADGFFLLLYKKKKKTFFISEGLQRAFIPLFFFNNPFDTKNTCCSCVDVSLYYLH